jgi:two-component system, cell cycle response regulator DivK
MSFKKKILYIEDNLENRTLVKRILLYECIEMLETDNAQNAIEIILNDQPDIILMDINMPDMDGYTLTGKIRKIEKIAKIPIIAITANVIKGDREKTINAGCDGYIEKPIDVDKFMDQINFYLEKSV